MYVATSGRTSHRPTTGVARRHRTTWTTSRASRCALTLAAPALSRDPARRRTLSCSTRKAAPRRATRSQAARFRAAQAEEERQQRLLTAALAAAELERSVSQNESEDIRVGPLVVPSLFQVVEEDVRAAREGEREGEREGGRG
eukprot:7376257-Prymnesium_polylepis.2